MKKLLVGLLVCVVAVTAVVYAQNVRSRSVFTITGSTGGNTVIDGVPLATPVAASFNYSVQTAATMVVRRSDRSTKAYGSGTAGTNLWVDCDVSAKIGGAIPTTDDYVIVPANSGSNAAYHAISAVITNGSDTNLYMGIQLSSAATWTNDLNVFIATDDNNMSIYLPAGSSVGNQSMFSGFEGCPFVLEIPAGAGITKASGLIEHQN